MKPLLSILLISLSWLNTNAQKRLGDSLPGDSAINCITTKLDIPFGTIAKLQVEVYDGDSLHMMAYQGIYLLKVNSVSDKIIDDTLLLKFTDETEKLANDDLSLSKLTYGKKASPLTAGQLYKMKRKYIGKKFTVMAYETGQFTGIPDKYFGYRPLISGKGFHFEHYLIIVSNITK